jgi:BirA family biotin operon repressor/biotin-[acetyl-CoA-carboxylase] ligase
VTETTPPTPLSLEGIREALAKVDAGCFGAQVHYFASITSTNNVARNLAAEGAPEGTLVVADEQTRGRGRRGRRWDVPPNTALLMSVIFRPFLAPMETGRLVMMCGLAAAEAIETLRDVRVDAKWPNDLHIKGKKVAGILAESAILNDQVMLAIAGIGINVNVRFEPDDPLAETATSLLIATGQTTDRAMLLAQVIAVLNRWYSRLRERTLDEAWRARMVMLGQRVRAMTPDGPIDGVAEDVDATGALWFRSSAGEVVRLMAGEVSLMPPDAEDSGPYQP